MLFDLASTDQSVSDEEEHAGDRVQGGIYGREGINTHASDSVGVVPPVQLWLTIIAIQSSGRYTIDPRNSARAVRSVRAAEP